MLRKKIAVAASRLNTWLIRKGIKRFSSARYWENRYAGGGTSGSGSYGRLAAYKADFINRFVAGNRVESVVEFGCGDGNNLSLYKLPSYVGFDVSNTAVTSCKKRFLDQQAYEFLLTTESHRGEGLFDLALSIDVIFHLIEDDIFAQYMGRLFSASRRFVVIYSYDFERDWGGLHEKGRRFSSWIDANAPGWQLEYYEHNPYPYNPADPDNTSNASFYVYKRLEAA